MGLAAWLQNLGWAAGTPTAATPEPMSYRGLRILPTMTHTPMAALPTMRADGMVIEPTLFYTPVVFAPTMKHEGLMIEPTMTDAGRSIHPA